MNPLSPGSIEIEFGVPIPGEILPPEKWARTAIKRLPERGPLSWRGIFGREAPVVLDLGCGNGRFVVSSAVRRPEVDHVGVDILPVVIRYATRRGNQRGLSNTRFAVIGGFEFLETYVPPGSVAEVHIYHPQPFHDATKMYRRLITPEFLSLVTRSLTPQGKFVFQTDDRQYWRYLQSIAPRFFDWHEQLGPWPEDPEGRTRREIMARGKRLSIFRGWGIPLPNLNEATRQEWIATLPLPEFQTSRSKISTNRRSRRRRK